MNIVDRAAWGARPPAGTYSAWRDGRPEGTVVHWVGSPGSMGLADHSKCAPAVRSIQLYEMSGAAHDRYIDIAYSVLVCPHGAVFIGRGFDHASAANGPATNGTLLSACFLGGTTDHLTPAAESALREVAAQVGGRRAAHRDVNATDCPGDEITAWVHGPFQTASPVPPPPAQPPDVNGLAKLHAAAVALSRSIVVGPVLARGSSGPAVKDVQFALVLLGQNVGAIDGLFGPNTLAGVTNVQRFWHLTVDGIVGPQTRRTLGWLLGLKFH